MKAYAALSLPLRRPRPGLAAFLESALERSGRPVAASYSLRARTALVERLSEGEVTVEHVARRLNVSARTLHRRLGEEGVAFRQVLMSARFDDGATAEDKDAVGFAHRR